MDRSPRHLVCPVLVGRDDLLALADRRIAEVGRADGRFLLLAGEAGVGKTRLLGAIERRAVSSGLRTVRAGAYPSDLQVPGAILLDLARALGRQPGLEDAAARLEGRLGEASDQAPDDPARRRRLLVLDVAEILAAIGSETATVVGLEDIHWSDDLTLEVLEVLARLVPERRLLVIATYRSDELHPRAPMREWRARIVNRREAEEVRLARLSPADTSTMSMLLLGAAGPIPHEVAEAIQARTDGIPLHVEELLGLLADGPDVVAEDVRRAGVPDTVEDAILARLDRRSAAAAVVARAGAVIGRSFDLDLLAAVTGLAPAELSAPLAELADHFILMPAQAPGRYGFRHALICDAIYEHIPEPERRALHGRTADAADRRLDVRTGAFLALHFERAGRPDEAFAAAVAAADAAAALSSHSEAMALYRCALRTAPMDLAAELHARLLEALGSSAAASDDNVAAAEAFERARERYLEAGQSLAASAVVGPLVAARHLLGDDLEERARRLREALTEIPTSPGLHGVSPDPAADRVRGRLLSALASSYMLDRRLGPAIDHGTDARDLAELAGDPPTMVEAATTLGVCHVFAGRPAEGWAMLEGAIHDARAGHHEAVGARAYRMIGSTASVLVEYARAERWLREGIEDAERLERWNDRHYMAAHLAHVAWATGRWAEAEEIARRALADGRGGITTRTTALHVLGFVALGRGQLGPAIELLDEARLTGRRMGELQRLAPALWGLAEVALARDDAPAAIELAEEARAASAAVDDAAYVFPFLVTGTRAYLAVGDPHGARRWFEATSAPVRSRSIPGTLPAVDHARGLIGLAEGSTGRAKVDLLAAVDGWTAGDRVWEGTWARLDAARAHARTNQRPAALQLASAARDRSAELGAPALQAAASELLRSVGRGGEPEAWAPLTAREFEVARCIAEGRTNADIAGELHIATKTVASHVEHILAKLGVDRRTEIAAWTASRPVLHSRPSRR